MSEDYIERRLAGLDRVLKAIDRWAEVEKSDLALERLAELREQFAQQAHELRLSLRDDLP